MNGLLWKARTGGFTAPAPGRMFFVDVGHSLQDLWFATERTYPGGDLSAQATFQGPQACEQARLWCERRAEASHD